MWRRFPKCLSIIWMIILVTSFSNEAAAQRGPTAFAAATGAPTDFEDVKALVWRAAVRPRLYKVTGPEAIRTGEDARFSASANIDAVTLPIRLEWDFGDGIRATGLHAVHRYEQPGTYTVTVSISNRYGSAADTMVVEVLDAGSGTSDDEISSTPRL